MKTAAKLPFPFTIISSISVWNLLFSVMWQYITADINTHCESVCDCVFLVHLCEIKGEYCFSAQGAWLSIAL